MKLIILLHVFVIVQREIFQKRKKYRQESWEMMGILFLDTRHQEVSYRLTMKVLMVILITF